MFKLGLAAMVMMAGAAVASPAGERMSEFKVDGFVVLAKGQDQHQSMRELTPAGETAENWTRLLTELQLFGLSEVTTPAKLTDRMIGMLQEECPKATIKAVVNFEVDGFPASRMEANCPLYPDTGKHEAFISMIVAGPKDFHNRQVAFRHTPTEAENAWARALLDGMRMCQAGSTLPGC